MRKQINRTVQIGLASLLLAATAHAQSSEALLDALVRKGVLTEQEAEDIKSDLTKENKSVNKWKFTSATKSLSIGGDFRGRFEGFYSDNPAFVDRNRFRYRLRAGMTASLTDNIEAGLRLTSSERAENFGGDPISGNTTFADNASKKFAFIDLAYGRWTPDFGSEWTSALTVGKMENPFVFSEMVFDPDYTPEGLAGQLSRKIDDKHTLKLNLGGFALDEISASSRDPYLLGAQLRMDSAWNTKWQTTFGVAGLLVSGKDSLRGTFSRAAVTAPFTDTNGITHAVVVTPASTTLSGVPDVNQGNTRGADGHLQANFNPIVVDAGVTYTLDQFPAYNGPFPIRLAGEYMHNPGAEDKNQAFAAGVTLGKSGKKGLWDVSYRYKVLEADVWYEELVDSDFGGFYQRAAVGGRSGYGAGTNLRGHIFKASYSPLNSLTLGITYFMTELIDESPADSNSDMSRLQVDAVWKF